MKLKKLILCTLCAILSLPALATESLRVAKIFSDHMVLQQQSSAPIWGWAAPESKIVVKSSWDSRTYTTRSDSQGAWKVAVETPSHGGPYSLKISSGREQIELKDILIGEVWVCSGQSNMEMPISGFLQYSQPVEESLETCLAAENYGDRIRIFGVPRNPATEAPKEDLPSGEWRRADFASCASCSAIAYFFAQYVNDFTHIPVGVIYSAWEGTAISVWMPRDCHAEALKGLVSEQEYEYRTGQIKPHKGRPRTAGTLFNGMINPIKGYAARGFLWYQGCTNKNDNTFYDKLQAAMVERWRKEWGDNEGKMPFYYVLIAPFLRNGAENGFSRGYFVENQAKAAKGVPNSAYACTEGLGGGACIHPAKKKQVSRQLALLALDNIYSVKSIDSGVAEVVKTTLKENKYIVEFTEGKHLMVPPGEKVMGFEIAGEDRVFYPAKAKIWNNTATVYIPEEVATPHSLRYSFRDNPVSNIHTHLGFPVAPFRTDDWELSN